MGILLWHYTTEKELDERLSEGRISPTSFCGTVNERRSVWFTASDMWDPVAGEFRVDAQDKSASNETLFSEEVRFLRIGIMPDFAPFNWNVFKRMSGVTPDAALTRVSSGHDSDPNQWFFSFDPVAFSTIVKVEEWNGHSWAWVRDYDGDSEIDREIRWNEKLEELRGKDTAVLMDLLKRSCESPIAMFVEAQFKEAEAVKDRAREAGRRWSVEDATDDELWGLWGFAKDKDCEALAEFDGYCPEMVVRAIQPDADDLDQFWKANLSIQDREDESVYCDEFLWAFIEGALEVLQPIKRLLSSQLFSRVDGISGKFALAICREINTSSRVRIEYVPTPNGEKVMVNGVDGDMWAIKFIQKMLDMCDESDAEAQLT